MAKTTFKRDPITDLEDLRDDCIAVVLNSRLSFAQVHQNGGPTPQTTSKWLYKETRFPRLDTARAMLQACGHDIVVMPKVLPESIVYDIDKVRPHTREKLPRRKYLKLWNAKRKAASLQLTADQMVDA